MSLTDERQPRSEALQVVQAYNDERIAHSEAVTRLLNLGFPSDIARGLLRVSTTILPPTDDRPVTGEEPELPGLRAFLQEEPFANMRVRLVGDGCLYLMEHTFDLRGYGSGPFREGRGRYWDVYANLPEHRFPAWAMLHLEIRIHQNTESP